MQVIDFLKKYEIPKGCGNHAKSFPRNIFCMIAGSTGSGKNQSDGQSTTPRKQN